MKILPLFIPNLGCPFQCVFCDQQAITHAENKIDFAKMKIMIQKFCHQNKNIPKQIAFFGGTFTNLEMSLQKKLLKLSAPYHQELQGIRISTRPDFIDNDILDFCEAHHIRTIELGVQSFSDLVLKKSRRGYDRDQAIESCNLIKSRNFELGIQLMPGLPGFSTASWTETIKTTKDISLAFVRIYPTIVLKNTLLEKLYQISVYSPLSLERAVLVTARLLRSIPDIDIAKLGLHSDIDPKNIVAGPYHQAFGELVHSRILQQKIVENFQDKTLQISARDISLFLGFKKRMLSNLKTKLGRTKLPILVDHKLERHNFLFTEKAAEKFW